MLKELSYEELFGTAEFFIEEAYKQRKDCSDAESKVDLYKKREEDIRQLLGMPEGTPSDEIYATLKIKLNHEDAAEELSESDLEERMGEVMEFCLNEDDGTERPIEVKVPVDQYDGGEPNIDAESRESDVLVDSSNKDLEDKLDDVEQSAELTSSPEPTPTTIPDKYVNPIDSSDTISNKYGNIIGDYGGRIEKMIEDAGSEELDDNGQDGKPLPSQPKKRKSLWRSSFVGLLAIATAGFSIVLGTKYFENREQETEEDFSSNVTITCPDSMEVNVNNHLSSNFCHLNVSDKERKVGFCDVNYSAINKEGNKIFESSKRFSQFAAMENKSFNPLNFFQEYLGEVSKIRLSSVCYDYLSNKKIAESETYEIDIISNKNVEVTIPAEDQNQKVTENVDVIDVEEEPNNEPKPFPACGNNHVIPSRVSRENWSKYKCRKISPNEDQSTIWRVTCFAENEYLPEDKRTKYNLDDGCLEDKREYCCTPLDENEVTNYFEETLQTEDFGKNSRETSSGLRDSSNNDLNRNELYESDNNGDKNSDNNNGVEQEIIETEHLENLPGELFRMSWDCGDIRSFEAENNDECYIKLSGYRNVTSCSVLAAKDNSTLKRKHEFGRGDISKKLSIPVDDFYGRQNFERLTLQVICYDSNDNQIGESQKKHISTMDGTPLIPIIEGDLNQ